MTTRSTDSIIVPDAPKIAGLTFRRFRKDPDYPHMLEIERACRRADDIKHSTSLEEIINAYEHLTNCDPYEDMIFAEFDGQVIGYGRVFWEKLSEGIRIYNLYCNLLPEWRHKGIGTAMLHYNQSRTRHIAAEHPQDGPRYFQSWAADTETSTKWLLDAEGYEAVRTDSSLVRDLLEPIPETQLPQGLEIRPVKPEHIWPIFNAANEAFQDHWGFRPTEDEEFKSWMNDPNFRPELWKVAWDGDQVAGSVQNYLNPEENEEFNRKRGYTEGISTRRPWRKRGLATALIVESMKMFKEMGMTETAHGVDAENTSGALLLYQRLGYKVVKQYTTYRKPMT
jgi:ribosomal protein S18 acetylase RimI-like enzyme